MYKKQMLLQKIVCMMALIASALVFVSSLGLSTDLYDALSKAVYYPGTEYEYTSVTGATVYYNMFDFNSAFTVVAIGLILVNLVLFITNTHSRRKYYIGNYIATGLSAVASVGVSIWCLPQIAAFKERFRTEVNFEELEAFSKDWGTLYIGPDDTFWFDICYFVFGLLLLTAVLLVVNCVLKMQVMKAEQQAIGSRKEDLLK